jgi:hypothetical protein
MNAIVRVDVRRCAIWTIRRSTLARSRCRCTMTASGSHAPRATSRASSGRVLSPRARWPCSIQRLQALGEYLTFTAASGRA